MKNMNSYNCLFTCYLYNRYYFVNPGHFKIVFNVKIKI